MKLTEFQAALDKLSHEIDMTSTPIILHFRITTSGGTKPENCHPFPVTDNIGLIQKLAGRTDLGVAHNGIINITPRRGISDTMEYILTHLSVMKRINKRFPENKHFRELIESDIGSDKMAFLTSEGHIFTVGKFIDDVATGMKYSNSSYEPYEYKWGDSLLNVCDVADLGGVVNYMGNSCYDYGEFFIDKKNKLYVYDPDEDALFSSKVAKLTNKVKYDPDLATIIPYEGDCLFEDSYDYKAGLAECYCCGDWDDADEMVDTKWGTLCKTCAKQFA